MRKLFYLLTALMVTACQLTSCAQGKKQDESKNNGDMKEKKILVAFYSRAGENYSVGNVSVGNTQKLAEVIAAETGGTLFQIKPQKEYPADYTECTEVAKAEKEQDARPAIVSDIEAEQYDIIFLGYPIWWGDAPMPVYTFLAQHKWQGKTVIPFCTHEGSGYPNEREITKAVSGATVLEGLGMYGHTAQKADATVKNEVKKWIKKIGL